MAFDDGHPFTPKEKKTGYTLDGKEVVLTKKRGHPRVFRNPAYVPQDIKVEAAALYVVLGDVAEVARLAKVSEKDIREWKEEPWWAEIQCRMMVEQNEGLLHKINTTVEKALAVLEDRILSGDSTYIPAKFDKSGNEVAAEKTVKTPIKARDAAQIFTTLTHQRQLMRGDPTNITQASSTEERLKLLKQTFKELGQGAVIEGKAKLIESK